MTKANKKDMRSRIRPDRNETGPVKYYPCVNGCGREWKNPKDSFTCCSNYIWYGIKIKPGDIVTLKSSKGGIPAYYLGKKAEVIGMRKGKFGNDIVPVAVIRFPDGTEWWATSGQIEKVI